MLERPSLTFEGSTQVRDGHNTRDDVLALPVNFMAPTPELTSSRCCSGSGSFSPSFTLTVTRLKLAPVILVVSGSHAIVCWPYPGSLTMTLDTFSTEAFPPSLPDPCPVSSYSSFRAVDLGISGRPRKRSKACYDDSLGIVALIHQSSREL